MRAFATLALAALALSGKVIDARHLTHTSAECCSPGWYLVDGDGCPGSAAIESNDCTGDNVCCSEGPEDVLHDPEHEREVADEKMGTLSLREQDRGDHGHVSGGGKGGKGGQRSGGGGQKVARGGTGGKRSGGGGGQKVVRGTGGKRSGGKKVVRKSGGKGGSRRQKRRNFFARMRARFIRRRNRRRSNHY